MRKHHSTRRATSLLVLLAMLIVSVAALLPTVASADPVGDHGSDIQDFSYQTLSSANPNDDDTDLRFMFTVGSLDYDAVGFVFSTSDSAPTAGGKNTYSTDIVYRTITANGDEIPAPTDRYWVAVKLSDILLSDFETTIYVRPFIKDGANYSYVDAASLTVLKALTLDKVVAGEGSIYNSKSPSGPYVYGVGGNHFFVSKTVEDIKEDKVFHPTSTNTKGNDLWFEYSFLWNASLANWDQSKSEMMLFGFRNESAYRDFYYLYTNDGQSTDCPYAGHIDYSTYLGNLSYNCAYNLTSEGNGIGLYKAGWDDPITRNSSPYLYDEESQTTGGWHRLGFRYHQEVENDPSKGIFYTGYTELYINGVKVWKVQTDMQGYWKNSKWNQSEGYAGKGVADLKGNGLLLWEAKTELDGGDNAEEWTLYDGLYYKDQDDLRIQARLDKVADSSDAVYVGVADICWTCGNGFAHPVSAVNTPASRTLILNDKGNDNPADDVTTSSAIWYVYDN